MSSVENRLTALASAIERRQLEQVAPIDPLSASLFALEKELAGLDAAGKVQLLTELNNPADTESGSLHLSLGDVEKFISDFTK